MEIKNFGDKDTAPKNNKRIHSVTLENRNRALLSGVLKVIASSAAELQLETSEGYMTISGEGMKINRFDVETGAFSMEGKINVVKYHTKKAPLIKRIFK